MSPFAKISLLVVALLAMVGGIGGLKWHNARLRAEADEWRQRNAALAAVRGENRRLRMAAEQAARADRTAEEVARAPVASGPARVVSADTTDGLVPIEAFRNLGRGTPHAAFETIIWAVVKGDDATMIEAFSLSDPARAKAEAILARLPAASRAQYATPEKLAGVFFSAGILVGADRFQILGEDQTDPTHATLRVRTVKGKEEKFPMVLGTGGWRLAVPERAFTLIDRILTHPDLVVGPTK